MSTPEGLRLQVAKAMLEKDLEENVRKACLTFGLRYYHTHRSQHSPAGFPDDVIVGPTRMIFRELKRHGKNPSPEQQEWLDDLARVGQDVGVWRPLDWLDGTITAELESLRSTRR